MISLSTASAQFQWERVGNFVFAEGILVYNDTLIVAAPGSGLVRSTDDGITWQWVSSQLDFAFDLETVDQTLFAAALRKRVYRSTDHGLTWHPSSTGISTTDVHRVDFRGGLLFALTDDGLFISTDKGDQWTSTNGGIDHLKIRAIEALQQEDSSWLYVVGDLRSGDFSLTRQGANMGINRSYRSA